MSENTAVVPALSGSNEVTQSHVTATWRTTTVGGVRIITATRMFDEKMRDIPLSRSSTSAVGSSGSSRTDRDSSRSGRTGDNSSRSGRTGDGSSRSSKDARESSGSGRTGDDSYRRPDERIKRKERGIRIRDPQASGLL